MKTKKTTLKTVSPLKYCIPFSKDDFKLVVLNPTYDKLSSTAKLLYFYLIALSDDNGFIDLCFDPFANDDRWTPEVDILLTNNRFDLDALKRGVDELTKANFIINLENPEHTYQIISAYAFLSN